VFWNNLHIKHVSSWSGHVRESEKGWLLGLQVAPEKLKPSAQTILRYQWRFLRRG
jgi:hypothetical protein